MPPGGSSLLISPTFLAVLSPNMGIVAFRAFLLWPVVLFQPFGLAIHLGLATAAILALGSGSRLRVCQARSSILPHRIEFTFELRGEPAYYGPAIRFQLLSTVGLPRR